MFPCAAGFSSSCVCSHHPCKTLQTRSCPPNHNPSENHGGESHQERRLPVTSSIVFLITRGWNSMEFVRSQQLFSFFTIHQGLLFEVPPPPFYGLCTINIFLINSFKRALSRKTSFAPAALRQGTGPGGDENSVCQTLRDTHPSFVWLGSWDGEDGSLLAMQSSPRP